MDEEIKILFRTIYLPIANSRNRYNGNDFLEVAVKLLDEIRKQTNSSEKIRLAAVTMVHCFNDLLDPKISLRDCDELVDILVRNSNNLNHYR